MTQNPEELIEELYNTFYDYIGFDDFISHLSEEEYESLMINLENAIVNWMNPDPIEEEILNSL